MKILLFVVISFYFLASSLFAQQDTIIYDQQNGNYIFQYLRENPETGERDSLVQVTFVPRTKINPSVRSWVVFLNDSNQYQYNYTIHNGSDSEQNLLIFLIEFGQGIDVIDKSTQKWFGGRYYSAGIPQNKYDWMGNQGLQPTWNKSGFILGSNGIPGIGHAYFQGKARVPSFPYGMPWEMDSVFAELDKFPADYVKRSIVVPIAIPNPFIPLNFLDTLTSYTTQSRSLGWIKDQQTADKYIGYFNSAKTGLQQNNIASTRAVLNQALQDVNVDSTSNITSEVYALIRFNSEYLLEQLPQQDIVITVPEMLDTLSTRLQISYTNNWIGSQTFVQILEKNIQDAKSKYAAKDSIGCAQEIESFYKLVRLRYLAPGMQFVKPEAYNLLYNYAREITGNVIVLPQKSNATLIDQITALKSQIRTDASVRLLGGELLLRGLESSLDIAKQRLQKSDSTASALYITLFQQTVRQTYEITKKYPASRIYIKAGGYISLYYRAEYILEHLTIPIGQPMPKMSKELEEELGKYREVSR
ncbi:MAG: hypothetical protein JXA06_01315 [Bacteroidetes bacterium]|nr:hypothetical protein [Bacteroidota bacterium]